MLTPILCLAAALVALPDDNPSVAPGAAKPGIVQQWKAADGLAYEYRVPKRYDPAVGANLTLVLHGNGLDHRWTFWNHPHDEFRVDDLVVSPDGTTPHAGTGANEFLGEPADVARLQKLILELREVWNVRQVFVYGHSQGSFFAFYFAGAAPELVHGVCGHASGVWNWTEAPKKAQHQAIGFLHGTHDHIPYGQSLGGREFYAEQQRYPLVHLRTLFDWDHRPHWYQAAQVLAWCEGMTSTDPARVAAAVEELADTKRPLGVDWSALHAVGSRLAKLDGATDAQKARGAKVVAAVDELAESLVASIQKGAGKKGLAELSPGEWSGLLARFDEEFHGTPAWAAFQQRHAAKLAAARDPKYEARSALREAIQKDEPKALDEAVALLERGFLVYELGLKLGEVDQWLATTKARLPKKARERYKELAEAWREGREDGFEEFVRACAAVKL